MYYNTNKANSDYYNTYKQEMASLEDYHENFSFQKIIKIGFTILMIGLVSIFTIYLVNYFSTDIKEKTAKNDIKYNQNNKPSKIGSYEDMLPKSIQFQEYTAKAKSSKNSELSPKNVAIIVEMIISQMKEEKNSKLERELLLAEENIGNKKTLKESNHYNKVVVSNVENKNSLDSIVAYKSKLSSDYEKEIQKEINIRSNEMRIIVVQRGDTLSKIAKKAYGNFDAYPKILIANPEIVKNPDEIFVGQKLRIPA